jgi:hypothetical protein
MPDRFSRRRELKRLATQRGAVQPRWSRAGTMTTGRESASATLLGNSRVLLAGGGNPSALIPDRDHGVSAGRFQHQRHRLR